jgi:hypothetical protein
VDQIVADDASDAAGLGRPNERAFNDGLLIVERDCHDTLHRNCVWHVERDDKDVDCDKAKQP